MWASYNLKNDVFGGNPNQHDDTYNYSAFQNIFTFEYRMQW